MTLSRLVDKLASLKLLVLGDVMLDVYLEGHAVRTTPESAAPVLKGERQVFLPGGAANTAAHAQALGADVLLVSVVGSDATADALRDSLLMRGVKVDYLISTCSRPTTRKTWLVDRGRVLARYDIEDDSDLARPAEQELIMLLREIFPVVDAVVVSDYLKGVITWQIANELARLTAQSDKPVVVDSKDLLRRPFRRLAAVTPNQYEALRMCGRQNGHGPWLHATHAGLELLGRLDTRSVVITCGQDGAILFERGRPPLHFPVQPVDGPGIGAGDAFAASLALALGAGANLPAATELASTFSGLVAARDRSAAVCSQDLITHLDQAVAHSLAIAHDSS